jgi:hypothetical protein
MKGTITSCTFKNTYGPLLEIYGSISISDSLFEDNNCQSSDCISFRIYSWGNDWLTRNVTNNTFLRNRGTRILAYHDINGEYAQFWNNSVYNNTLVNPTNNAPLAIINGKLSVRYNRFENADTPYDVNILLSASNPNVDLTRNWWGSTDESLVRQVIITLKNIDKIDDCSQRIFDFLKDSSRALGLYLPYLLDPYDSDRLSAPITQIPFIKPDGTIGGEMSSSFTITLGGSPYTITSTIVIPPAMTLTIEAGVEFKVNTLTSTYTYCIIDAKLL